LTLHKNSLYAALQWQWGLKLGERIGPEGSFLQNLASFRDFYLRWQQGNVNLDRQSQTAWQAEEARALAFVRRQQKSMLGPASLCLMQEWSGNHRQVDRTAIAEAWQLLGQEAGLAVTARYEQARN